MAALEWIQGGKVSVGMYSEMFSSHDDCGIALVTAAALLLGSFSMQNPLLASAHAASECRHPGSGRGRIWSVH